jgi:hypothetical protein
MQEKARKKLFGLVFIAHPGAERRSWHASRKEAELVGIVSKWKFRIEEFDLPLTARAKGEARANYSSGLMVCRVFC